MHGGAVIASIELGKTMRVLSSFASAVAAVLVASCAAYSADFSPSAAVQFSGYELRIAGLEHNMEPHGDEHGFADMGGSILFPKMATSFTGATNLLVPRIHVGGTANFSGKTSFAYAGVTWSVPFADVYFASLDFGGAVNNSVPEGVPESRVSMGCHATFRESAAIGRSITSNIAVAATIEHFSNANLCDKNAGITNLGVMVSYRF